MLSLFRRSHNEVNKTSQPSSDLSHFCEDVDEMGAASSRDGFIQTYPQRRMTTAGESYMTKEKKMMRKNRTGSMPPPVQTVQKISDVPTPYEIRQMMEKRFVNGDFQRENSSEPDSEEEADKMQAKLNDIEESIHQVERRLLFNPQLTIPFTKHAQIHYKKRSSTLTENSNSSQETTPKSRAKFFRKKADNLSNSQTTLESENSVKKNSERKRALTAQLSSSSEDSGIDRRLSLDGENDGEQRNGEKQKKKKDKSKSLVKKFKTRARSRSLGFLFGEKPQAPLFGTSYLNREWEIVTVKEMCRRLSLDEIDHIEMPIPEGAETSQVLDELMIRQVMEILPARAEGYPWVQIYNSEKHGFSLATLYRKMVEFDEDMSPVLLIIRDTNDHVFGAIVSSAIRPHEGYWGTGDSCLLWKFTGEVPHTRELRHFTWTGDNQFFVNAAKESLSIGAGGGHQGLWLDADLNHGRSQKCETFDNEPLAGDKEDFIIQFCEAFGFRM